MCGHRGCGPYCVCMLRLVKQLKKMFPNFIGKSILLTQHNQEIGHITKHFCCERAGSKNVTKHIHILLCLTLLLHVAM